MNDFHTDWEATDNDQPVAVRIAGEEQPAATPPTQTVSRRPAAIVGVVLASAFGFWYWFPSDSALPDYQAQVAPEDQKTIRILPTGLDPVVITAVPGETVTWINEQDIPHFLQSDTLCGAPDNCMRTDTMFSGEETTYTIPPGIEPGAYTYFSPTDPNIIGTISVGGSTVPPPAQSSAASSSSSSFSVQNSVGFQQPTTTTTISSAPSSAGSASSAADSSISKNPLLEEIERQLELDRQTGGTTETPAGGQPSAAPAGNAIPGIPQNPYTVGTTTPSPAATTNTTPTAQIGKTAQKPFKQPDTGAGNWIAAILGMIAFAIVWKRARLGSEAVKRA